MAVDVKIAKRPGANEFRSNAMKSRVRVTVGASFVLVVSLAASVEAQQPNSLSSVERVRIALERAQQQPRLTTPIFPLWTTPAPKRFGMFTLLPPDRNGELIRVGVPVGDLVARATHAMSGARHRRAERKARERVAASR